MAENKLFEGVNQPVKLELPNLNNSIIETIKNSNLYKNATQVLEDVSENEKMLLLDSSNTNGWDTVSICRVSALNERIKAKKTYPKDILEEANTLSLRGEFAPWQIVTGGDGRNVKLNIPMKEGLYTGMEFGYGKEFDIAGISVDIYVKLSYFPTPDSTQIKDGNYDLFVRTDSQSTSDPIAAVVGLNDPSGKIDSINISILRGLFESWLNRPENLKKFETLFSTVLINNMGSDSEEFKWLRATFISYAYTDLGTQESSIFGVLCMTNQRESTGINQIPPVTLKNDDNAIFLINREVFVRYQLLPSLPYIFPESKDAVYEIDQTGTTIVGKNIQLDSVRVGAIDYHPVAKSFEITFDESFIRTTANINTVISPGIDVDTIIITKQTFGLGKNDKGEQIMVYNMVGEPIVTNQNNIATWIVVTEAIIALIGAVIIGVAAKVASKLAAFVVGVIVAVVVAMISILIHVIIEKVIAEGATKGMPSIEPMVRVATKQIKWPFCQEDAFVLTDIKYFGAIIFEGKLKLEKGATISNNCLAYS